MHISWARLASFCHFGFISDPLIVSKFHNETNDPKGQENKIYTIVKGRVRSTAATQSQSPAIVKSNMFLKGYPAYASIEDSDQTAHPRIKGTSRHMRQSKTQIRLRICTAKVTSWHMRQSKTQIRLRIPAQKEQVGICVNPRLRPDCASAQQKFKAAYAPIEDSDQNAHPRSKVTSRHITNRRLGSD